MDVIGYQGAVLGLVLADEPVLHAVIDEKSRPAGADIQEPVRCLVQCIDMNRLDWKGDMSAGPPVPVKQVQPHAGTDPHPFRSLLQYGGDGARDRVQAYCAVMGIETFEIVAAPCPYTSSGIFSDVIDILVWTPLCCKGGGKVFHPPGFLFDPVQARSVPAGADDTRRDLAERQEDMVPAILYPIGPAEKGAPPSYRRLQQADPVAGGESQVAFAVFDDIMHLIVNQRPAVAR